MLQFSAGEFLAIARQGEPRQMQGLRVEGINPGSLRKPKLLEFAGTVVERRNCTQRKSVPEICTGSPLSPQLNAHQPMSVRNLATARE